MTDEGTAKAIEEDVPASAEETAQEAMENCPVGAIGQVCETPDSRPYAEQEADTAFRG